MPSLLPRDPAKAAHLERCARLDTFTLAYIRCALWSSTDDQDKPMDRYSVSCLSDELLTQMEADCAAFQAANGADMESGSYKDDPIGMRERAGADFWLTRNGHGCGFWDGDWREPQGEQLTVASTAFGTVDLYVGDDGRIYA